MKTSNRFLLSLLILTTAVICNSCQTQEEKDKINNYSDEFNLLIDELVPNHAKLQDGMYYLIFNKSCEPCIFANIMMLEELPSGLKNFSPVFLGQSDNREVSSLYDDVIQVKFENSMFIEEFSIQDYRLDVIKPLLLHFKNGQLVFLKNYNDFELQEAEAYILANLE